MSKTMIQYLKDGSYHFVGDLGKFKEFNGLMTGQEFYDRFQAQLAKPWTEEAILEPQYSADEQVHFYTAEHVHEAAMKAAGIE